MKKILLALGVCGAVLFTACDEKPDEPKDHVSVTGVTLNHATYTLNLTDNKQVALEATVSPNDATNKSVRWESSNTAVATVNGAGVVTALTGGTTTITVFTLDTTAIERTATCLITVDAGSGPPLGENRLVSKMSYERTYYDHIRKTTNTYEYNAQNRIAKLKWLEEEIVGGNVVDRDETILDLLYNSNGTPAKIKVDNEDVLEFTYSGNQVIIPMEVGRGYWDEELEEWVYETFWDTLILTLNNNGQVIETTETGWRDVFTYNSNGNLTKIVSTSLESGNGYEQIFTYSNTTAKAVFRHANVPEWLLWFLVDFRHPKNGFMPTRIVEDDDWRYDYTYTVADDYVKTRTATETWTGGGKGVAPRAKFGAKFNPVSARKNSKISDAPVVTTYEYINAN
ncbi:MAG: Ig-like domain-containing protein [Bacteroidales bacterium]|jgi:hypothetical protein|nr:Ig-like domain-containing protein [Bacteroidales bacterium]